MTQLVNEVTITLNCMNDAGSTREERGWKMEKGRLRIEKNRIAAIMALPLHCPPGCDKIIHS